MRAGRSARLCVVPALAGIILVAIAAPAWAHAVLNSTDPPKDGVAAEFPPDLSLTFTENVEISFGAVRVYTCAGQRVTTGTARHAAASDHTVLASIPKLAPGIYLVVWHVISADAHPVGGTYALRIGPGPPPSAKGCTAETNPKSSVTVGALFGVARAGVFAGLALLIGGAVFLLYLTRGSSAARSTGRAMWIGWIVLAISTVVAVMLQGPYAAGSGIGDAFKWSVVHDVLQTRFGHVTEVRSLLLLGALALLAIRTPVDRHRHAAISWKVTAAIVAIGLAGTAGYAGHAATGDFTIFAVPLDTIHVLAMSVWLGGLVVLLLAAFGGGFSGGLRRALTTFSRVAFWCVVVLVATGVFASWREVGFTTRGYTSTSYGHLLLIKLGVIGGLVALAAVSRSIVRRHRSAPLDAPDRAIADIDERTVAGLRRTVAGEVLFGIAVLAATAMLVNAQPARSAVAPKLYSGTVSTGTGESAMTINVTIDPARVGLNTIHVYTLTPKGEDLSVREISAKLVSADRSTSVPANLARAGANHFLTNGATIPTAGKYQMLVQVLQVIDGRLIDTAGVLTVPIR